ncbi:MULTISPECIES: preprotein translocase subunit SecG [unclassified Capnocytophaga]|jgi:protein translocase, SecG subunit|uniref:preprotein translocase subunit SecG n=1 Tax=unclassified Capnocytophaga TaxID=2640652 RepID=UPI000202F129|nr:MULTISPECIES: preprotein translocase subunit SecG [unclassified Capnocytophaga]EGD34263.1 preprotein translocase subunit SecG [Capnocytophaga sp. oral taxon 338 str. F0234]MEB3004699.1 preprotein translocase subunit SecG [Capnocytophaga sp. G2]
MLTFNIVLGVILLVSFLLVLVIMVQQPKSGGLSSSFGGNAQVIGGVKKTGDFLNTSTWTLGVALIVLSLISNLILSGNHQSQGSSIFDDVKAPVPTQQQVPTTPVQQQNDTQKK